MLKIFTSKKYTTEVIIFLKREYLPGMNADKFETHNSEADLDKVNTKN